MENVIKHKTLANGLNIYLCPDRTKHTTTIDFIVKYGGFYSDFVSNGITYHMNDGMAHLLEHLMCEKNSQGCFWELFGKKQMQTNACTWPWITEFYVDTVEDVEFALENLIIALSKPVFTEQDIEETKPPIFQEIKMRGDQVGRQVLYKRTKNVFKNITYIGGLGSEEDVKNFTYEQVKLCYDTFYQPKNEILFISGHFDEEEIFKKIESIYEKLAFKDIDFSYIDKKEPKEVAKTYEVIKMPVAKDYVDVCYKLDFTKFPKEKRRMLSYYLSLFLTLNFSRISPLYKSLIDQQIIEEPLSYNHDYYQDYLIMNVGGYVNNEEEFIKSVKNVFTKNRFESQEIFDLRLKKMKMHQICADLLPFGVAREFVDNVCIYDYPGFDSLEEINSLNYQEYLEFINSLEFSEYTITKVENIE